MTANRAAGIPGLFALHVNRQAEALRTAPWPELLTLLGKSGEQMMIDLLLDCGIFTKVTAGRGNYTQLSGIPVSELDYWPSQDGLADKAPNQPRREGTTPESMCRTPSAITFVRSRMLYARAALNARGLVHFGLRHIRRFPPPSFFSVGAGLTAPCRRPQQIPPKTHGRQWFPFGGAGGGQTYSVR